MNSLPLRRRVASIALIVAMFGLAGAYALLGAQHQWDFETYYRALKMWQAGADPYALTGHSDAPSSATELPFLYPPITLFLFLPLVLLPINVAAAVWFALKCLLAVVLLRVWARDFLSSTSFELLVAVMLFGFNLAVLWDLRTGNVAIVEAALLWFAFSAYLRNRLTTMVILIVAASVFKLLPVLLLGLLAMAPRSPRFRLGLVIAGVILVGGLVALPSDLSDNWLRAVSDSMTVERPIGEINPSALGLTDWLVAALELPRAAAPVIAFGIYVLYCAVLLGFSITALRRAYNSGSRVEQVVIVVLLWLLLVPRLMVYSYVMAIVPVLYVIQSRITTGPGRAIAVSVVLAEGLIRLLPGRPPAILGPLSYMVLLGAWGVYTRVPRLPRP